MLDEQTRAHCHHIQALCIDQGLDLFETLERAGLLVSHDKGVMVQKGILAMAIIQLEDQQHTTLAFLGGEQTVTGAVRGCVKFLEMFTKGIR